jgi:heterodisulfide reductase subunit A2
LLIPAMVDLVEKEPSIGGRMAQLDKTFPTLDCSACILTPKMVDVAQHDNITCIPIRWWKRWKGTWATLPPPSAKNPQRGYGKCTGCGVCWEKCPVKVDSEFEMGWPSGRPSTPLSPGGAQQAGH